MDEHPKVDTARGPRTSEVQGFQLLDIQICKISCIEVTISNTNTKTNTHVMIRRIHSIFS